VSSILAAARDRQVAQHAAFAAGLAAEPSWLASLRREAIDAFAAAGVPDTRQEEWRYTNVAPIAKADLATAGAPAREVARADLEAHAFPVFACSVYVFVNGRFAPELSAAGALPGGVRVDGLRALRSADPDALAGRLGALADVKRSAFAALNTAFLDDGAVVRIPRGAGAETPIHLVFVSAPEARPSAVHPRVLVEAGEASRVCLIQDHVCVGNAAGFTNPVTEIHAGPAAHVDFVLLQREPDHRFHVSALAVRQERASRVATHTLALGGALVRNDAEVVLAGEGAECELRGLYVGGGRQLVDNHTTVDHAVPRCASRELYKGVLGGAARGVFRGRVIVRPDAQKTDASQQNRNLLIGRGAEADSKPQLEIYADDVKCSHGSSIGQLDADALFYLRSRGLDESRARDLLTRAFAAEVLAALPVPALGDALDDLLADRLHHARLEVSA
jgi:Fe-S cluster assembly protein SufD